MRRFAAPFLYFYLSIVLVCLLSATITRAQSTGFTYQGRLVDAGASATGSYDMQFTLFNTGTVGVGSPLAPLIAINSVPVTNGIFTVQLDFGACSVCFDGGNRFLEIAVKLSSGSTFTTLSPRQPINSTPYALRSVKAATSDALSASCLNCVTSSQIQTVGGSQVTGNITGSQINGTIPVTSVPSGSANYIQNATAFQTADFSITGTGKAFFFDAVFQYNINGNRALAVPGGSNVFAGDGTGTSNSGVNNSFFGHSAGIANTSGDSNSFFGSAAGGSNTTGFNNSYFGEGAGTRATGNNNSFFGIAAGGTPTAATFNTANENSFFGSDSGRFNTTGDRNAFFGYRSGRANASGNRNSFFGHSAGMTATASVNNSFFGFSAGAVNSTGNSNSFFGASAGIVNTTGTSNSFFGSSAGVANVGGDSNAFFGQGAGSANTDGDGNTLIGKSAGDANIVGTNNTIVGSSADVGSNNLDHATAIGAGAVVATSNTIALGRSAGTDTVKVPGKLVINSLSAATNTPLCINASAEVSSCSSSRRYKSNILSLKSGLNLVERLRPVMFDWKESGEKDLGLIAEEVEAIYPLLVTRNTQGEIQGVKYNQLNVLLINAVQQQQAQIEQQNVQLKAQEAAIKSLKALVCLDHPNAQPCKK